MHRHSDWPRRQERKGIAFSSMRVEEDEEKRRPGLEADSLSLALSLSRSPPSPIRTPRRHRNATPSMQERSREALTSVGFAVEAPPALAAPGEDEDDGALLPLPLPPPAEVPPDDDVARAEAALLPSPAPPPPPPPPPPPADDDVAATIAAHGLATTGAAVWSSGISRRKAGWKKSTFLSISSLLL